MCALHTMQTIQQKQPGSNRNAEGELGKPTEPM